MGDTTTHGQIADEIIPILKEGKPDDEMNYFELGNWLTDLSQFRDPTAMVGGKHMIWDMKTNILSAGAVELFGRLEEYLDQLMGTPGPQGGLLAAWFREMAFAATNELFQDRHNLPEGRIRDIFDLRYTQYYPHEHVDFPPWPRHDIVGERNPSEWSLHQCAQPPTPGSGRKLYQYQEEQLVYISDLLTVIEHDWARKPVTPDTKDDRETVLTRFGHASHAMEDFFFHSNFVEQAWKQAAQPLPSVTEGDGGGDDDDDDHEEPGPRNPVREERRYYRRLRCPVGKGDDLSTTASKAIEQVFTGFFGGKDVFHTFVDGLKGLKKHLEEKHSLIMDILSSSKAAPQEGESQKDRDKRHDTELAEHKKRVLDGSYVLAAKAAVLKKQLHQKSADAIENACKMDKDLWDKFSMVDLGISGFVIKLLQMAEDETADAKNVWSKLDADAVKEDDRSDNGASNEAIGSHSLMSKDSVRKHPLRNQAFNVASTIGLYVAKRMVEKCRTVLPVARSVNQGKAPADGGSSNTADVRYIDWLHVLQHFISHPEESEPVDGHPWWSEQMKKPDPDETGHSLRFIDDATVQERLQEKKKLELEKKYDDLAVGAEKEWRKDKGKATGNMVGMAIGAVAGAVAGAIIGAALGGVGGAILGGIIGAVAGAVVGGLIGSLLGGLFS